MKNTSHPYHKYLIFAFLTLTISPTLSLAVEPAAIAHMTVNVALTSPYYPVVLRGNEVKALLGAPNSKIRALVKHSSALETIPFQIDKRESNGGYDLSVDSSSATVLATTDECVFMSADAGERITQMPPQFVQQPSVEIAIIDPKSEEQKWVYLVVAKSAQDVSTPSKDHVVYDPIHDVIETNTYRIGFSSTRPFIINNLQWHTGESNEWSLNQLDTMKIRHYGKLFGNINFFRTEADYKSRIAAIKDGPVRLIRRTINSVRVFSYLQSPSVTIDYVVYANGFQMDTTIDFPFPLGWFFTDIKTYTTIDWNDNPSLPRLHVFGSDTHNGLAIDGHMSQAKTQFNKTPGQRFAVENIHGLFVGQLEIGKSLPIDASLYLQDDRTRADTPENIPGQYGNVGFLTTGWEKVGTSVQHLRFNSLLLQNSTVDQGMKILSQYPWRSPTDLIR